MARSWFRSGLMLVGLGLGLGTLVLSCSQKVTEKTAPAPEAETVVTGTLDVSGGSNPFENYAVDTPANQDSTKRDPTKHDSANFHTITATLSFAVANGTASNITINSDLNHGWSLTSTDKNGCQTAGSIADGTSCTISITLDPTNIDLGDGDLLIPFTYETGTGAIKTGTVSAISYHSKNLKWKSPYVSYFIGAFYQDSSVAVDNTTDSNHPIVYFAAGNSLYAMQDKGVGQAPQMLWKKDFYVDDAACRVPFNVSNPIIKKSGTQTEIYLNSYSINISNYITNLPGWAPKPTCNAENPDVTRQYFVKINVSYDSSQSQPKVTLESKKVYGTKFVTSPSSAPIILNDGNFAIIGGLDVNGSAPMSVFNFKDYTDGQALQSTAIKGVFSPSTSTPPNPEQSYAFLRSKMEQDSNDNLYVNLASPSMYPTSNSGYSLYRTQYSTESAFSGMQSVQNVAHCPPISTPVLSSGKIYSGTNCGTVIYANVDNSNGEISAPNSGTQQAVEVSVSELCDLSHPKQCQILTKPLIDGSLMYFGTTGDDQYQNCHSDGTCQSISPTQEQAAGNKTFFVYNMSSEKATSNSPLSYTGSIPTDQSSDIPVFGFTGNPVQASPGSLVYTTGLGSVYGLDSQARNQFSYDVRGYNLNKNSPASNGLTSNPVLAGDTLYVLSNSGYLYALKVGSSTSVTSKQTVPQAQKKTQ